MISRMNKIAKFYDGRSSISISVQIDQNVDSIFVKDTNLQTLAQYAYSDLLVIEMPTDSLPGVFGSVTAPDVRLHIEDSKLFTKILSQTKTKMRSSHVPFSWTTMIMLSIATIGFAVLIFKLPYNYSHLVAKSIPQSWDDKFGKYAAKAVTKDYAACTNSLGQNALEKLVKGLVEASGNPIPMTIKVFDDDSTMNAFAMSGNQIFVFSGLIKKCEDYDELAGVLAHEMGHVLKRHPTEGVIHALGLTLFFKLLSGGFGQLDYILNASNLFLTLHYSRVHEIEADDVAIQILTKTGIGTRGFVAFFNKLQAQEKGKLGKFHDAAKGIEGFLSTHPLTEDRINRIKEKSSMHSVPKQRILTKVEWAQIKDICRAQDIP